jgi:hypothetical protein
MPVACMFVFVEMALAYMCICKHASGVHMCVYRDANNTHTHIYIYPQSRFYLVIYSYGRAPGPVCCVEKCTATPRIIVVGCLVGIVALTDDNNCRNRDVPGDGHEIV